jgi:hypothetical protein
MAKYADDTTQPEIKNTYCMLMKVAYGSEVWIITQAVLIKNISLSHHTICNLVLEATCTCTIPLK